MKNLSLFCLLFILLSPACKKTGMSTADIIHDLVISNRFPLADGATIVDVGVYIDSLADADKRNVIFTVSGGMFLPSRDTMITQAAVFESGRLVARVKYQVPMVAGTVQIKVRPATVNAYGNPQQTDSITVRPSVPASLRLLPSLVGLRTGFNNEITLTATLKNSFGGSVSLNHMVRFEQGLLVAGNPVAGIFRARRDSTDMSSTATSTYTAGNASVGTVFWLRCTWLDPFGNLSSAIKDSCLITIAN